MRTSQSAIKIILYTTLTGVTALELLLFLSIFFGSPHAADRALAGIMPLLYIASALYVFRCGRVLLSSWMIVIFYYLVGFSTSLLWGINAPVGILMLTFSLFLSALLLPIKYIFINASLIVGALIFLQTLVTTGAIIPDAAVLSAQSTFVDVLIYAVVLIIFSVLSWAVAVNIKESFARLEKSNLIINKQKRIITSALNKERAKLQIAEIKRTSHMQQFSEVGQFTALLMHELSNELAVLKMNNDDLSASDLKHTIRIIDEIEKLVLRSRKAMNSRCEPASINNLLSTLKASYDYYCSLYKIKLSIVELGKDETIENGQLLFQVLAILVKNSIDAYYSKSHLPKRALSISARPEKQRVVIRVQDWAGGIDSQIISIFDDQHTTKEAGHGVGLPLSKLIVTERLRGSIRYMRKAESSLFIITLPIKK